MTRFLMLAALLGTTAAATTAHAQNIYTGGPNGAYNHDFCPPLARELGQAYYNPTCTTSAGTVENINKVLANPKDLGFGQFDVVALMASNNPEINTKIAVIRDDVAKECLFVITNNPRLLSVDDLSNFASRIPFILPPKASGSSATFELLQKNNDGLARAHNVSYAESTDDMVKKVLDTPTAVGLFVQLPDPNNAVFKTIAERKGRFVSVVNRGILAIKVGDKPVYAPVETSVVGASVMHPEGGKLTTTCTSTVVFTGKPEAFPDGSNERKDQQDLIKIIADIDRTKLLPKEPQQTAGQKAAAAWGWLSAKASVITDKTIDGIESATAAARKKLDEMSN